MSFIDYSLLSMQRNKINRKDFLPYPLIKVKDLLLTTFVAKLQKSINN